MTTTIQQWQVQVQQQGKWRNVGGWVAHEQEARITLEAPFALAMGPLRLVTRTVTTTAWVEVR